MGGWCRDVEVGRAFRPAVGGFKNPPYIIDVKNDVFVGRTFRSAGTCVGWIGQCYFRRADRYGPSLPGLIA